MATESKNELIATRSIFICLTRAHTCITDIHDKQLLDDSQHAKKRCKYHIVRSYAQSFGHSIDFLPANKAKLVRRAFVALKKCFARGGRPDDGTGSKLVGRKLDLDSDGEINITIEFFFWLHPCGEILLPVQRPMTEMALMTP